jgi:hypothetical protein
MKPSIGPYTIDHVNPWPNCPGVHDFVIKSKHGFGVARIEARPDWEEMEANANLLSAAPDLLEALKLAVKQKNGNDGCLGTDYCLCWRCKARAAIAKARGSK